MIQVAYSLCPTVISDSLLSKIYSLLPASVVSYGANFYTRKRRLSFLLGRLILSEMLKVDLALIQVDKYGKPYLPGCAHFNISHSKNMVICAVSERAEVGVDVEFMKDDLSLNDYVDFLNEQDYNLLKASDDFIDTFYKIWTAKESVMKADGRGFNLDMKNIDLYDGYALIKSEKRSWYIHWLNPIPKYQIAVCSSREVNVQLNYYDIQNQIGSTF